MANFFCQNTWCDLIEKYSSKKHIAKKFWQIARWCNLTDFLVTNSNRVETKSIAIGTKYPLLSIPTILQKTNIWSFFVISKKNIWYPKVFFLSKVQIKMEWAGMANGWKSSCLTHIRFSYQHLVCVWVVSWGNHNKNKPSWVSFHFSALNSWNLSNISRKMSRPEHLAPPDIVSYQT